jgi:NADP-dependent 3-hydroxy acid dehydrogenase YdfG
MNQQWHVKEQVVVITGASKGIGLGTAKSLIQRGARVALLARGEERLQAAVAALDSENALGIVVDASDRNALDLALQEVWRRWGRLDGMINNVGFQFARRIEVMPEEEVLRMVGGNFLCTVFGCQVAIPYLRRSGGGRIVNISSSSVRDLNEFPHLAVYSACKAAVERFTVELREELREDNIRVTLFSSGSVHSGSIENFDPEAVQEALEVWKTKGLYYSGSTTPEIMGAAVAQVFEYPPEIAAEFVEVRPGQQIRKFLEAGRSA